MGCCGSLTDDEMLARYARCYPSGSPIQTADPDSHAAEEIDAGPARVLLHVAR